MATEIVGKMSIEQKLVQTIGMFGGERMPKEILYKFPSGLGEICFMPETESVENNADRAETECGIMKKQCGIPAIRRSMCGQTSLPL